MFNTGIPVADFYFFLTWAKAIDFQNIIYFRFIPSIVNDEKKSDIRKFAQLITYEKNAPQTL